MKGGRQREKQKDREGEIIQYNQMIVTYSSHACTPVLVGMASSVSEILLLSKTAKFPFLPMDYSPWSSKNLMDRNWLKKFMQVGVDVTYMHTNFGFCGLSGFGDIATFKNGKFPFPTMDYSPWSSKNLID